MKNEFEILVGMIRRLIILFFILNIGFTLFAQQESGFKINSKKKIVIPFRFINNLIFIEVEVNGVMLTFMLDSGVGQTILLSLEDKEVEFENIKKVKLSGLGSKDEIDGLISIANKVAINKKMIDTNHRIIIILKEDFNFSSHVGIPINGILGYDFFKNYPVYIDFEYNKIYVYPDTVKFQKIIKREKEIDITIEKNKPYTYGNIKLQDTILNAKLLIDLGNSDGLWLFPKQINGFKYPEPNFDDYLGRGFNGDIYGKRSKVKEFSLLNYSLEKPLVTIPSDSSTASIDMVENRKGSIGNEILKRFSLYMDYPNQKIYVRKNSLFNNEFKYNLAGIDLKFDGMQWAEEYYISFDMQVNRQDNAYATSTDATNKLPVSHLNYKFVLKPVYSVAGIRNNSPASEADIKENDILIKINGKQANQMKLESLIEYFYSQEGKVLKMEFKRGDEILKKTP
ncbi:MAG TPA: PDZ domain-containing protein [Bacteroidales bacterium]|nr:PDZ domain-containing protein [Bacteroidales bacterium]